MWDWICLAYALGILVIFSKWHRHGFMMYFMMMLTGSFIFGFFLRPFWAETFFEFIVGLAVGLLIILFLIHSFRKDAGRKYNPFLHFGKYNYKLWWSDHHVKDSPAYDGLMAILVGTITAILILIRYIHDPFRWVDF